MQNPEQYRSCSLILNEQTFPIIEQITAGMPGGFFIYHADGDEELIYVNQSLIRIFGCDNLEEFKELTGYVFSGLIHPEDLEMVEEGIKQRIFTGSSDLDYIEYRIIRKDGSIRLLEDYGYFIHTDSYGDVFYVFVEDATEKKCKVIDDAHTARLAQGHLESLESSKHETTVLKLMYEILQSGIWTMEFDSHGNMASVYWSQEFRAMIGYQNEQDFPNVLSSWSDLIHPEDRDLVLEQYYNVVKDYTDQSFYDVEYRLLTKDQGYRWFRTTGKFFRRKDGTPITYVGMFIDVTLYKDTDEMIMTQHKFLEDALIEAQEASQAKTDFLNNMSHDIRTPMNAIIGFTNLALTHLDNRELLQDYLSKIATSSNHLLSLVNDVLNVGHIESGKVVIEETPCSLPQILLSLQNMIQADLEVKNLHFSLDDSALIHPYIVCDQLRLNQVLLNVLGNALKFTPDGGSISLTVTEQSGDAVNTAIYKFCIKDTGIGMSPEFLEHIFEPFERERTSTISGIDGVGLGMSITKDLTELMNGQITVESEKDYGSTFTLTFPFYFTQVAEHQDAPEISTAWDLQGRHLLLVEDNELNQEIALSILEDEGCIVDVASNGAEAVEKVSNSADNPYDLVLMDIQMPVMDGIEATHTIRTLDDPLLSRLPIVAMTANALEEDRQRTLAAGMNAHLGKPIDVNKLFSTLQNILDNK